MTRDGGEATAATVKREAVHFEKERGVTEIRILREVAHVTVSLPDHQLGEDRLKVLQSLAAHTVPIFLVKLLPTGFSFAVRGGSVAAAESALEAHRTEFGMVQGLCVVTTVAGAMRDLSGIMAAIYETLNEQGIRVQQTGDAYNAVLCLVAGDRADAAAQALRRRFTLGMKEGDAIPGSRGNSATEAGEEQESGSGLRAL